MLFQGRKYLAIGVILPHVDWQYFQLVPTDQILSPLHQSFYVLMTIVLVIGILIGLLINFAVKRSIVNRLHVLVNAVRSYGLGDLSARANLTGDDEITATSHEFNVMADQLKQSLIELKDSEFRWKFAIESSGDVLWDSNEIDQTVIFSKGWKELTGFADDEINKIKEWENLIHANDKVTTLESMQDCLDGKTLIYISEYRSLCKDGSYKWIFDRGVIVSRNENGKPLRMIGISSDITARKVDEDKLRIAAIAFESQEGKLISDANNIILQVNKAFTEITGYDAEDVIGKTPRILSSGRQDKQFYTLMWESLNSTGEWKGEVWNKRKNGELYSEFLTITAVKNADGIVMNYVATLTDNTKTHAATAKIDELAFYDALTKLPNRQLLLDRLNQALASRKQSGNEGALMFIDLDDFKTLNDTLGHDVGDLLLIQCAARISSCIREGDTVARLGGDEFVVLLENLSSNVLEAATLTETIAENIITALNVPCMLNGFECQNTASIGVVQFDNQNDSQETLFKHADIALYQAKRSGRNRWCFFDPHMQDAISARVDLVGELRKAIDLQQFQLHYQIQVDSTGHAVGAEVLIRWNHPKRGMVSPFDFIPLAEETGLILPIGQWVLETACAQLAIWQNDVLTCNLTLAVNVSAQQFRQVDFVAKVQMALNKSAIDPTKLKLELTESLLVENIQEIVITMVALKTLGIKFSMDDFGTGYSSLQYLKKLPLDQLKIDQSFVRDLVDDSSDKAIVLTVITMANSLGLNVIAEGVETEDQRQFLLENGCLSYQGYLFSKPLPLQSFETLLKQYT